MAGQEHRAALGGQLAAAGLAVWVGSRDAARGERAVEEIDGDARLLVLDVTDAASIAAAARQAGTLDILVNNAGISGDGNTADREDVGTFRRIYETNVFGIVAVTNAFLPTLHRSAHPRIVNISSGTGSLAWVTGRQFPHQGAYAAYRSSKAALNALTVYCALLWPMTASRSIRSHPATPHRPQRHGRRQRW
jgi:NAD(P)-dependent dehydrogenase (short-subunit alcohol dehydrogenase family)